MSEPPDKPRVLHVYKDFWPPIMGGAEKTINLMCRATRGTFRPEVLVSNRKRKTERGIEDGWSVTKVATFGRALSAPLTPTLGAWMRRLRPDLYHIHLPNPTAVVSALGTQFDAPIVVTWHSDIVRQAWALAAYRPLLHRFLDRAARIMPTSPLYIDRSDHLPKFRDKCAPVPLAIDLGEFEMTNEDHAAVEQYRSEKRRPAIAFVGVLRYYKGLHLLIEAAMNLDAELWIIGRGPEHMELERIAHVLRLQDRVRFFGFLEDAEMRNRLRAADIYCQPSHLRAEAFGINQVEAMACGLPVVSTDIGGVPFVNRHEETGLIVEPGSAETLSEALTRLLNDESLRQSMTNAGRRRVREEFDLPVMGRNLMRVYRNVLGMDNDGQQ